jgi:hypothetical protein
VIDLVHPSLFCYVKGLTVVGAAVPTITGHTDTTTTATTAAAATATSLPSPSLLPSSTSSTTPLSPPLSSPSPSLTSPPSIPATDAVFQWLPSEFRIDESEGEVMKQNNYS